jgi:hypothetical protein
MKGSGQSALILKVSQEHLVLLSLDVIALIVHEEHTGASFSMQSEAFLSLLFYHPAEPASSKSCPYCCLATSGSPTFMAAKLVLFCVEQLGTEGIWPFQCFIVPHDIVKRGE